MKKKLIVFLIGLLVLAFTSCGTLEKRYSPKNGKELVHHILDAIPENQAIVYVQAELPVIYQYNKDSDCFASFDTNSAFILKGGKLIAFDESNDKPVITNQVDILTLMRKIADYEKSKVVYLDEEKAFKTKTEIVSKQNILAFYEKEIPELREPMERYLNSNFEDSYNDNMAMELYLYQDKNDSEKTMGSLEFVSNQPNKERADILSSNKSLMKEEGYKEPDTYYINWFFEGISKGVEFDLSKLHNKPETDEDWFELLTTATKDINEKMIDRLAEKKGYDDVWVKAQKLSLEDYMKASSEEKEVYQKEFIRHLEEINGFMEESNLTFSEINRQLGNLYNTNKDNEINMRHLNSKTAAGLFMELTLAELQNRSVSFNNPTKTPEKEEESFVDTEDRQLDYEN